MPYYLVRIRYVSKLTRKTETCGQYDMTEEEVTKLVAEPYMNGEEFMFLGRRIDPNQIEFIHIFRTEQSVAEMIKEHSFHGKEIVLKQITDGAVGEYATSLFITSPPPVRRKPKPQKPEVITDLMDSASFLKLDINWSSATCALQLQEVAMTLTAKKKNIKLDKASVEKLLNKKIEDFSFNDQYEAFSKQVKVLCNVDMPLLTTDLRQMRRRVLHQGYNPTREETDSIMNFTIGLLRKFEDIS